jgi:hypothetical protein
VRGFEIGVVLGNFVELLHEVPELLWAHSERHVDAETPLQKLG